MGSCHNVFYQGGRMVCSRQTEDDEKTQPRKLYFTNAGAESCGSVFHHSVLNLIFLL